MCPDNTGKFDIAVPLLRSKLMSGRNLRLVSTMHIPNSCSWSSNVAAKSPRSKEVAGKIIELNGGFFI